MLIHLMEVALKETIFLTQSQALFSKAIAKHITQQNAEVLLRTSSTKIVNHGGSQFLFPQ